MRLLGYPDHIIAAIASYSRAPLYCTCERVRDSIRRATTYLEVRLLKCPSQVNVYPSLVTLRVHAIDLRNHSLPDYLHTSIRDLQLMNVTMTRELYKSVPTHILRLTINRRENVYHDGSLWSLLCADGQDDYYDGHYCEYNMTVSGDAREFLHESLAHLETEDILDVRGLNLESAVIRPDDEHGIVMPSSLTSLVTTDLWEILPPQLTSLCALSPHEDTDLSKLPPNLTRFRVRDGAYWPSARVSYSVHGLPSSLTDLMICYNTNEEETKLILESNITTLGLESLSSPSLLAGSRLVTLYLQRACGLTLDHLPETLRFLSCINIGKSEKGRDWVPLEVLFISSSETDTTLPPFPLSLRSLRVPHGTWSHQRKNTPPENYWRMTYLHLPGSTSDIVFHTAEDFPPSLTTLRLTNGRFTLLSVPSGLLHLTMGLGDWQPCPPLLPSGLLVLHLIGDTELEPDYMRRLPSSLRELSINEAKLSRECLKLLPKKLVRLDAEYLDNGIEWMDLPESLAFIAGDNDYDAFHHEDDHTPKHPALCHRLSFQCLP